MVFGLPRRTSIALVGWLWADILLGLMALFLAANSAGTAVRAETGIDPKPVIVEIAIDGPRLLGGSGEPVAAEQRRIASEAAAQLQAKAPGRRVALVLAYGRHAQPGSGDQIARLATQDLAGPFAGAPVKTYHEIAAGDRGTTLTLEVYLYQ